MIGFSLKHTTKRWEEPVKQLQVPKRARSFPLCHIPSTCILCMEVHLVTPRLVPFTKLSEANPGEQKKGQFPDQWGCAAPTSDRG